MMALKKVKAGALQFVLFVGAIVAILLLSFVLLSYSHVLFKKKTDLTIAMIQGSQTALEQSFNETLLEGEHFLAEVDQGLPISAKVLKSYWGIWELRNVTVEKNALAFNKIGLVGRSSDVRPALYLKDNQRPMVIAGKARVIGDASLPQRGIKRGNIKGYGYSGDQLIFGRELQSSGTLPGLEPGTERKIKEYTDPFFEPSGEEIKLKKGTIIKNSFKEPTKVIKGAVVQLAQTELMGNIVVWASKKIEVDPTAMLNDIVLIAPLVEIKDGVNGNFQALANRAIRIGKGCTLNYPTALVVNRHQNFGKGQHPDRPDVFLGNRSVVKGMVIYQAPHESDRTVANIHFSENSLLVGEVYCTGNIELKGTVQGFTVTDGFVALESGSAYQNHLFNGTINREILPGEYAGLPYKNEQPNTVLKWLY
nr:hypothetical protein [Allomuricauda sp.]